MCFSPNMFLDFNMVLFFGNDIQFDPEMDQIFSLQLFLTQVYKKSCIRNEYRILLLCYIQYSLYTFTDYST